MENELAVSVRNIQSAASRRSSKHVIPATLVSSAKEEETNPDDIGPGRMFQRGGMDEKVENELGHRFELVEPTKLASMINDPAVRDKILAVDVRGRDWVGGHIPSSINLRTSEVTSNPSKLISQCYQKGINHLVFTCMYSVLRARKCAVAIEQEQQDLEKKGQAPYKIRISLLAGGMHAWVNNFCNETSKEYINAFDAEMWSDGGPSQGGLVHVMDALWSSGGQKALSDALSQELEQLLAISSRRSSNTNVES
eukprot:gnl/TRDRNA2_/TRDRNA2_76297_c1_seq1.p1 gnl/TRDRNA2_/TRDRNA2_76297_c1~~gnl/TRDRNA2_/TRDRNA2_76297_c1_seq1.p1  ORF type:complete len:253 (-),score=52.97 gnl/TRDRNA2_/TRDRNA2_76297_c1_seq1:103-861(-)